MLVMRMLSGMPVAALSLHPFPTRQRTVVQGTGNTCPAGYSPIVDPSVCLAALELAGQDGDTFMGSETASSDWPAGCYFCPSDQSDCDEGTWFNPHPTGSAHGDAAVWCEKGLTPVVTGQLLLIGDSDVDLWPSTHSVFPGSYDIGYAGYTCNNLLGNGDAYYDLQAALSTFKPSRVFLICGENDMDGGGKSASVTFSRLKKVVAMITASGARVFMMGTKPEPQFALSNNDATLLTTYQAYDTMVQGLAASLAATAGCNASPPLVVYDSYSSFIDNCNPYSYYQNDLFHMDPSGYAVVETAAKLMMTDTSGCQVWRSGVCVQGGTNVTTAPAASCVDAKPWRCHWLRNKKPWQLRRRCVGSLLSDCAATCCFLCNSASAAE